MTETDMPEEIWVNRNDTEKLLHGVTGYRTTTDKDISPSNTTQYRLKSTVDAERAADSKTIAALAKALEKARIQFLSYAISHANKGKNKKSRTNSEYMNICGKALADNAPRIAEAQEAK